MVYSLIPAAPETVDNSCLVPGLHHAIPATTFNATGADGSSNIYLTGSSCVDNLSITHKINDSVVYQKEFEPTRTMGIYTYYTADDLTFNNLPLEVAVSYRCDIDETNGPMTTLKMARVMDSIIDDDADEEEQSDADDHDVTKAVSANVQSYVAYTYVYSEQFCVGNLRVPNNVYFIYGAWSAALLTIGALVAYITPGLLVVAIGSLTTAASFLFTMTVTSLLFNKFDHNNHSGGNAVPGEDADDATPTPAAPGFYEDPTEEPSAGPSENGEDGAASAHTFAVPILLISIAVATLVGVLCIKLKDKSVLFLFAAGSFFLSMTGLQAIRHYLHATHVCNSPIGGVVAFAVIYALSFTIFALLRKRILVVLSSAIGASFIARGVVLVAEVVNKTSIFPAPIDPFALLKHTIPHEIAPVFFTEHAEYYPQPEFFSTAAHCAAIALAPLVINFISATVLGFRRINKLKARKAETGHFTKTPLLNNGAAEPTSAYYVVYGNVPHIFSNVTKSGKTVVAGGVTSTSYAV